MKQNLKFEEAFEKCIENLNKLNLIKLKSHNVMKKEIYLNFNGINFDNTENINYKSNTKNLYNNFQNNKITYKNKSNITQIFKQNDHLYSNNSHISTFKDIGKHLVKIIFNEKMKKNLNVIQIGI